MSRIKKTKTNIQNCADCTNSVFISDSLSWYCTTMIVSRDVEIIDLPKVGLAENCELFMDKTKMRVWK